MLGRILGFAATSVGITAAIAAGLILSDRPVAHVGTSAMDFSGVTDAGAGAEMALVSVPARDGATLSAWHVPAQRADAPLLVLVHGSAWHGGQFRHLATQLEGRADIVAVNLRGHWNGPEPRGDIAYTGQLEDDLADVILALQKPDQTVILGGHSSGGGLVVRFAGGAHRDMIDQAILMAPFLKYDAPTTRENSGGWARVMTRRIIGLSMLNAFGLKMFDHLPVIQFAMPDHILQGPHGHEATLMYSWRLNTSFAPRRAYLEDVAALPDFTLLAGRDDESFFADRYEPVMSDVTSKGQYHVIDGVGHLGIVDAPETVTLLKGLLGHD